VGSQKECREGEPAAWKCSEERERGYGRRNLGGGGKLTKRTGPGFRKQAERRYGDIKQKNEGIHSGKTEIEPLDNGPLEDMEGHGEFKAVRRVQVCKERKRQLLASAPKKEICIAVPATEKRLKGEEKSRPYERREKDMRQPVKST